VEQPRDDVVGRRLDDAAVGYSDDFFRCESCSLEDFVFGMNLMAEDLASIDAEGMPAYLESSNPANLGRYESLGFSAMGEFKLPDDVATVTTMWRDPQ
jgi:hypothetical protein